MTTIDIWDPKDFVFPEQGSGLTVQEEQDVALIHKTAKVLSHSIGFTYNQNQRSPNTINVYIRALELFEYYIEKIAKANQIQENPINNLYVLPSKWKLINADLVEQFQVFLMWQGFNFTSINMYLSAIKMHSKWANKLGFMDKETLSRITSIEQYNASKETMIRENNHATKHLDPTTGHVIVLDAAGKQVNTVYPKLSKKKPEAYVLSYFEEEAMLQTCDLTTLKGRRDRAILLMLFDFALRVGELVIISTNLLDLNANLITVYRPKVHKTQEFRLTKRLRKALIDYIAYCPMKIGNNLFINLDKKSYTIQKRKMDKKNKPFDIHEGIAISTRSVRRMVNEKGWEIGLPVSLGPHDLRHTRITHFAEQGVSLYDLMEFGGWNSLDMARRYIKNKKVANEGLAKLIDDFYEDV